MKGTVWPRPFIKDPTTGARKPVRGSTWTYQFAVPLADRKRRFVTKGGFATRRAAEAALAEALSDAGRSPAARVKPSQMGLGEYLTKEWAPTLRGLKPTTRNGYGDIVAAYIKPFDIAQIRLSDLTAGEIAKHYDVIRVAGRRRARPDGSRAPLSESTIHHVHIVLSAAMRHAVEAGFLPVSPIGQLPRNARPKPNGEQKPERVVWSAVQARTFLAAAAEDRLVALFDLALNTGMRRGELCALRWVDIDIGGATVAVRRNRVTVGYKVEDGTPKSSHARVIELDPATVAMLKAHHKAQREERLAWGEGWQDTGLVFTREDGTPLHPQTAAWHLRRLSKVADVPAIRLHDLRHTHATLGLAAGVPPKVMQERLGHASVQITMDLYSHVIPGMQADAAARIGALLRGAS